MLPSREGNWGIGYWGEEGEWPLKPFCPHHWPTCFSGNCGWQDNRQCLLELVVGITGRVGRKVIRVSVAAAGALLWSEGWDWIWRGGRRRPAVSLVLPCWRADLLLCESAFRQQRSEAAPQIWSIGLGNCALTQTISSLPQSLTLSHLFTLSLCPLVGQWDWLILAGFPTFLILYWFPVTFTPLLLLSPPRPDSTAGQKPDAPVQLSASHSRRLTQVQCASLSCLSPSRSSWRNSALLSAFPYCWRNWTLLLVKHLVMVLTGAAGHGAYQGIWIMQFLTKMTLSINGSSKTRYPPSEEWNEIYLSHLAQKSTGL